jgi:predicted MPP superfamily phosphohydrolase
MASAAGSGETVGVSVLRLGVIADPHLALERMEDARWHNPFRLADAHERLDAALAHPLLDGTDVVVVLGDLAHFGDRTSMRRVVEVVASGERPAVLLSGNHDVLTPGARLEDEVVDRGAGLVVSPLACESETPAVKAFEAAGAGLAVHEVTEMTDRPLQPFDVTGLRLADADAVGGLDVFLTHFPVLTFEDRCRDAGLLYSAHLDILAPPPSVLPTADRPAVVLSGHLHLRGVTTEANLLQLVFAALVEPPYEVAAVEIDVDATSVAYRCASVAEPDAERLPVLDPASGRWTFDPGAARWSSSS